MDAPQQKGLYLALFSIHGLIRGESLELGCDADTGGQTLYVVELAQALARQPGVERVDLFTRRVQDANVSDEYAQPVESLGQGAQIIRIDAGPSEYIPKEQLWDHLDTFVDNVSEFFRSQARLPDILHSHYADAGYVGTFLAHQLGVPLIHTAHSLGRVKRSRLLASGFSVDEVEKRYNISRRIEAEEETLAAAERVITSTHQEIEEQYELYDHYQPEQMRVVPPGTDVTRFTPVQGDEFTGPLFQDIAHFLKQPNKPLILALSRPDHRKNINALIEAYGLSPSLQEKANLVIVAGNRDDIDELDEWAQEVFHQLLVSIDRYDLYARVALPKHHLRDQVPLFYRLAAASGGVFVNPALTEPFGLTLIEAAASGLPIVATEDGGPRDIISNCGNGILIDPLESDSITEALEKLLGDKEYWLQCSKQGVEGVNKHYSWDAHAKSYVKLVEPIIARTELRERKPIIRSPKRFRDKAIFTDLDQNLLGDPNSLRQLMAMLKAQKKQAKFGIATGRRVDSALKILRKHQIPEPDILITSGGTEIYYAPNLYADYWWGRHIDYHWTPHVVKKVLKDLPGLKLQKSSEQSRFKISYYIDPNISPTQEEISSLLHQEELAVTINFAFGQFLDILPIRASKGMALRYVAERWQTPLERIFVAGGSGADEDMMRGNTLAAVVANRHNQELSQLEDLEHIYFAQQPYAAGILEALEHYDFFNESPLISREQDAP